MTVFVGILTFFVILSLLVMAHELGHFSCAKLMGVRVDEFGLGFPPRVKGWKRGGTIYSINALPLGGFVKMLGENGEHDGPNSFGSKAAWQRFVILIAGPIMNIVLALAIFFFSFLHGVPTQMPVVTQVAAHSPAAVAGLHSGDRVVAVGSTSIRYGDDLRSAVTRRAGYRVTLLLRRHGHLLRVVVVPRAHPPPNQGALGIRLADVTDVAYSPQESASRSWDILAMMVTAVPQAIAHSFTSSSNSGVQGPIGIAHITTRVVAQEPREGPSALLTLTALLSANLGVLNLLPIPALDGGRIAFVLLSALRRRNLDPQIEGAIHAAGMALLLLLIVVISYNDIVRWVTGAGF
ncbi:MAG: M50 family metallopeptidase [Chloroflexota bacterium]